MFPEVFPDVPRASPSVLRESRADGRVADQKFVRDRTVGLGSNASHVVLEDGFPVTRRFSDPNCAGNDRLIHLFGEELGDFFDHLAGKEGPAIIHRHQNALEADIRVGVGVPDLVDHMDNLRKSFEAEPFALERDEDFICRSQCRGHQHAEGWRGVQDAVFEEVVGLERLQDVPQAGQVIVGAGELNFDASEVHFGWNHGKVLASGWQDLLIDGPLADKHGIHAAVLRRLDAESAGAVCLWIKIDQKHPLATQGESGGEIESGGGFTHAALLIGNGNNFHLDGNDRERSQRLPGGSGAGNKNPADFHERRI